MKKMTLSELLKKGTDILAAAGVENAGNEAIWMLEDTAEVTFSHLRAFPCEECSPQKADEYLSKIRERENGRPLQYILGHWDFYGRDFSVGEGVLIPRPETEMLVDLALEKLKDVPNPVVTDLCAGTGCIGLTVAAERPDSKVYLVEKYDGASEWLKRNREAVAPLNTVIIKGDVLTELKELGLPRADMVLSNPPYINSDEIPSLQKEVLKEPVTALDGGRDGLVFYRAIAEDMPYICKGCAAFECGENQAQSVKEIFGGAEIIKDFAGTDRVVLIPGEEKQ